MEKKSAVVPDLGIVVRARQRPRRGRSPIFYTAADHNRGASAVRKSQKCLSFLTDNCCSSNLFVGEITQTKQRQGLNGAEDEWDRYAM